VPDARDVRWPRRPGPLYRRQQARPPQSRRRQHRVRRPRHDHRSVARLLLVRPPLLPHRRALPQPHRLRLPPQPLPLPGQAEQRRPPRPARRDHVQVDRHARGHRLPVLPGTERTRRSRRQASPRPALNPRARSRQRRSAPASPRSPLRVNRCVASTPCAARVVRPMKAAAASFASPIAPSSSRRGGRSSVTTRSTASATARATCI